MDSHHINYVDNRSILIVNPTGKIRQLFCPFRVKVVTDTSILKQDSLVLVDEVKLHRDHLLLYRIGGNWWTYDLFRIAAVF